MGGFPLRKWSTNSSKLLSHIPSDWLEINPDEPQNLTKYQKLLGIIWNSNSDILSFLVESHIEFESVTKRKVLSMIAHLYDPLGLLSPLIVRGKILMQQMWKESLDWDDVLSNSLVKKWKSFYNELG